MAGALTDVPGLTVGHWTDIDAGTGCTVILCEAGAIAAVDVRGGAPATRETDLLRPGNLVERVNAILLSGGSAYGLNAAAGVMRYLEEGGYGFTTAAGPVPIVPAAALFDLIVGRNVRPDADAGYAACRAAGPHVDEGCVGAGTGASVAKLGGPHGAVKSGIGTASVTLDDGTVVAALIAVNALGAIHDPTSGTPIAAPRTPVLADAVAQPFTNTTIGVIATSAPLERAALGRLATVGHDGLALTIRPAHTLFDGDTLFALSLPSPSSSAPTGAALLAVEDAVPRVVATAVVRAVTTARPLYGLPAVGS